MRRLIVGCGYLGQRVARAWLDAGDDVTALTRSEGNADRLSRMGVEPIVGDVLLPDTLSRLPVADTLLYAVARGRRSDVSQRTLYVEGLSNVLRATRSRVSRLIYISSTSVYGQSEGEWVDEESACEPVRENGKACLEAEAVVWKFFPSDQATSGTGANVLRLAGIYGPGRLTRRIDALRSAESVLDDPDAFINLIHIDDAVGAVLACEKRGRPGTTYLVSDGNPILKREFYGLMADRLGAPEPTFSTDSKGSPEQFGKCCSNARLRDELMTELRFPTAEAGLAHALAEENE